MMGEPSVIEAVLYWIAAALLGLSALLATFRIVRGRTILDRMIASDVVLTTLVLAVGADMVIRGHTNSIVLMLVLSAVAIFATIAVARYVSKQDRKANAPTDGRDQP